MPDHPAGVLAWQHENDCVLRTAEDSTAVADKERHAALGDFFRPVTAAEIILLTALGAPLNTRHCLVRMDGLRTRTFHSKRP